MTLKANVVLSLLFLPECNESHVTYSMHTLLCWPHRAKSTGGGPLIHSSTCQSINPWSQSSWALSIYIQRFHDEHVRNQLLLLLTIMAGTWKSSAMTGFPMQGHRLWFRMMGLPTSLLAYQVPWWPVNLPKTRLSVIFYTWTGPRVLLPFSMGFLYGFRYYEQVLHCWTLVFGTYLSL